jgi:hypothetical protein
VFASRQQPGIKCLVYGFADHANALGDLRVLMAQPEKSRSVASPSAAPLSPAELALREDRSEQEKISDRNLEASLQLTLNSVSTNAPKD